MKHLLWVDYVKVLGLYLMILGHGSLVDDKLSCYIYSFHMPLFFIISGLLAKDTGGGWRKNFRSLIIPYLCMNAVCILWFTAIECVKHSFCITKLASHILAVVVGIGYETDCLSPVCTPMWFFYALFIVKVVYSYVPKSKVSKICQILACFIIVKILAIYNIDTYVPVDSAIMAYPFFLFGTEIKFLVNKTVKHYEVLTSLIVLVFAYMTAQFNGRCDINSVQYGSYFSLFILTGCATTMALLMISKAFLGNETYTSKFVAMICSGSPVIVGVNLLVINILKPLCGRFVPEWSNVDGVLLGLFVMFLFYPIIALTKRFAPFASGNRI